MRQTFIKTTKIIATSIVLFALYCGSLQLGDNIHEVVPGELYRSAQPSNAALHRYTKKYGIQSVINLRGENKTANWYQKEIETSRELGLMHLDFKMSAKHELTQARATELLALIAAAPKPVLVHCQAGADRTGLAAALYLASIKKRGEEEAESQISMVFGHLPFSFAAGYPMYISFESLEKWLGFQSNS